MRAAAVLPVQALRTWQAEERERTRRMLLHADGGRADGGYSSDELPGFGGVCDDSEDDLGCNWGYMATASDDEAREADGIGQSGWQRPTLDLQVL